MEKPILYLSLLICHAFLTSYCTFSVGNTDTEVSVGKLAFLYDSVVIVSSLMDRLELTVGENLSFLDLKPTLLEAQLQ